MKWGIIVLLVLGIVAAGSVALLVGALNIKREASKQEDASAPVEVVRVKNALPPLTRITEDLITVEDVPRNKLPEGQVLSKEQVLGEPLGVSVVAGQVLTNACLLKEGAGKDLAAKLPFGMRAVSLTLSQKSVPHRKFLYPGCSVDILFSDRLGGTNARLGSAISTTLLNNVYVLAIEGESVGTPSNPEGNNAGGNRSSGGSIIVTLMVTPDQAKALQLANDNGSIALTIRNPNDKAKADPNAIILNQGRMADFAELMDTQKLDQPVEEQADSEGEDTQLPLQGQDSGDIEEAQKQAEQPFISIAKWLLGSNMEEHKTPEESVDKDSTSMRVTSEPAGSSYTQKQVKESPRRTPTVIVIRGDSVEVQEMSKN